MKGIGGRDLKNTSVDGIRSLASAAELDEALEAETAVLYKYSNACWLSSMAWRQIRRFAKKCPEVPIYRVNVTEQRDLSDEIESRVGIRHESPQVIVLKDGEPVWHASHMRVRLSALQENTAV